MVDYQEAIGSGAAGGAAGDAAERGAVGPGGVDVSAVFHALADGHRRTIIEALELQPRTVGELAAPLPISLAAASKHVQVLERVGLVRKTALGRRQVCSLEGEPLRAAHAWIARYDHFWSRRFDELESALRAEAGGGGTDHEPRA